VRRCFSGPIPISVVVNTYNTYNAPVSFSVVQGSALLAPDNTGHSTPQSSLSVRSTGRAIGFYGSSYVAQVWVYLPSIPNDVSVIRATAVTGTNAVSVDTTAVTIDSSLLPPASFEATPTSATTVEIRWAGSTSTITLQASTDGGATWSNVAVVGPGVSRVIVTGLQPNASLSFRSFSGGENPTITVDGGTVAMPGNAASQRGGGGSSATASLAVTPLNHPVIEGEEKSLHLPAAGEFADLYVNDSGYEITRLQYRWKVNADPNLTVNWDVQFTPYDGGPLHHEVHQWVTQGASADPSAPYLIDPRYQRGGRNGYYDVILLQANLAVDGNRDGQMSFDDPSVRDVDKTTSDKPYRFWLNDDQDNVRTVDPFYGTVLISEGETVPVSIADNNQHKIIKSVRRQSQEMSAFRGSK